MKRVNGLSLLFLILVIESLTPTSVVAQERIRIGVPLLPTVSYPVFIAQQKGFFERNGLKAEIIRINSEPTPYQALISGDIDATSGAKVLWRFYGAPSRSRTRNHWITHTSGCGLTRRSICFRPTRLSRT